MPAPFTAHSALPGVQQLVADLLATIGDAGPIPALRELASDLAELRAYCESPGVDVDVAMHTGASADATHAVARWISPEIDENLFDNVSSHGREVRASLEDPPGVLRAFPMSRPPTQKVGKPRPSVLVCVVGAPETVAQDQVPEELVEDRPLVVWIAPGKSPELFQRRQPRPPWMTVALNPDALASSRLDGLIGQRGPDFRVLLRTYSALYGVETAADAVKLIVEREQRSIRVRRGLAQQEASRLQQPGAGSGEAMAEMRLKLQRTFSEFEKAIQERTAEAFAPQIGTLTQAVEQRLTAIVDLERTPREKSIELRLLPRDESALLQLVRDALHERMVADLRAWRDLVALVTADVDRAIADAGGQPIALRHSEPPDTRLRRVIDSSIRVDRSYRGEMPKHGLPEYLQQAKKYQVLLATVLPLLAAVTAWAKNQMIYLFVWGGLLLLGSLVAPGAIRRERGETLAHEVERARDILRLEIRRIFADVERGWASAMADLLRDEQSRVAIQFDGAMREAQLRRSDAAQEDRRRLQRQLQALENTDRQLGAARRGREAAVNAAAQLRGALRQLAVTAGTTSARANPA